MDWFLNELLDKKLDFLFETVLGHLKIGRLFLDGNTGHKNWTGIWATEKLDETNWTEMRATEKLDDRKLDGNGGRPEQKLDEQIGRTFGHR